MKRKIVIGAILAGTCCFAAQQAAAVDFHVIPRASVGYENLSIDWEPGSAKVADLNVNLATGTIGVTATLDKFYFDAYVGKSLEGSDDYTVTLSPAQSLSLTYANEWDVDVFDYAFTAGYNVWKTLAVYAGWKGHTTNMDGVTNPLVVRAGNNSISIPNAINWDAELKYNGPFIGVSFGLQIGESNLLSVNTAYAWMSADTELFMTSPYDPSLRLGGRGEGDSGDAGGLTIGVSWKGMITDALGYTVSADWYKYSFDGFTGQGEISHQDIDEEAYTLRFTASYAF